ncbi:hypothetical protein R7M47_11910 [Bacillus inaquosorum]|uniref:hypothetical protein n=1 Tax=Bacillus inaquosorum TaxID=483913 RepID=UPI003899ECE3
MNYSRVKKFFDENKEYSNLTGGVTDRAEDTTKLSSRPQEFLLGDESLLLQY